MAINLIEQMTTVVLSKVDLIIFTETMLMEPLQTFHNTIVSHTMDMDIMEMIADFSSTIDDLILIRLFILCKIV